MREGVEYYKTLSQNKKNALPCFPNGFARFGDGFVAAGLVSEKKTYLALWNLGGEMHKEIHLKNAHHAVCAYPKNNAINFSCENELITVDFTEKYQARFFEIT